MPLGGGLEMTEACMLRMAVPGSRLGHPEVRIGAVAGFGGTTRLPRLIGKGRAADLLTLEESALLGADHFRLVAATDDFREGTRAFIEMTAPTFSGG